MNTINFFAFSQSLPFQQKLSTLYGPAQVPYQKERYLTMAQRFSALFPQHPTCEIFSASGRIEVGGNHTDHQLGRVLAMAVDLDTVAFAARNDDNVIRFISKDYEIAPIDLKDLTIRQDEFYTTMGLLRGMARYFKDAVGQVGGFDAYVESRVFSGSGLSSSASVEVLIAKILDTYYGKGSLNERDYAIMAQKPENHYFNKPCGLMDQMVIAHGGFCAIDFYEKENPIVTKIDSHGLFEPMDLCLVQCGGSHADLSGDYAEIFEDCKALSHFFNQDYLSRVEPKAFYARLSELNQAFETRVIC